jgi:hypothetical protein
MGWIQRYWVPTVLIAGILVASMRNRIATAQTPTLPSKVQTFLAHWLMREPLGWGAKTINPAEVANVSWPVYDANDVYRQAPSATGVFVGPHNHANVYTLTEWVKITQEYRQ